MVGGYANQNKIMFIGNNEKNLDETSQTYAYYPGIPFEYLAYLTLQIENEKKRFLYYKDIIVQDLCRVGAEVYLKVYSFT